MKVNVGRIQAGRCRSRKLGGMTAAVAASIGLSITLVACAVEQPSGESSGADGAESGSAVQMLRYGLSAEPSNLKTGVDQGSAAKEIVALVRRGLLQYDSNGE